MNPNSFPLSSHHHTNDHPSVIHRRCHSSMLLGSSTNTTILKPHHVYRPKPLLSVASLTLLPHRPVDQSRSGPQRAADEGSPPTSKPNVSPLSRIFADFLKLGLLYNILVLSSCLSSPRALVIHWSSSSSRSSSVPLSFVCLSSAIR